MAKEVSGEYGSMFGPPSQPVYNCCAGEISNNLTNTYTNFTSISPKSDSSHSKNAQPQEFASTTQVFKHSLIESTAPQITQTIIAGECCSECCPVAAAQAAASSREIESEQTTNKQDLSNSPHQSCLIQTTNNCDKESRRSSAFRSIVSLPLPNTLQEGFVSICVSNDQKDSTTSAHGLNEFSFVVSNFKKVGLRRKTIPEVSKSFDPPNISNSSTNSQDVVSQNTSLTHNFDQKSNIIGKNDDDTLCELPSQSSSDIGDVTASPSSKDLSSVAGTKRKHEEIIDETRCLWATCAAVFSSIDDLIPHLSKLHVAGRSKGNLCRWASCSKEKEGSDELIQHLFSDHLRTQNPQHGCKWQGCYLRFVTFEELTGHVSEGHIGCGRSEYICYWEQCDRKGRPFTQRQKVMRHIQTHTGNNSMIMNEFIPLVSVTFTQTQTFSTGDKPYQCTICKKRFSEANIMTQHMRTHTGEKPYKCPEPECDKTFSISGALTIHLRVHTGT
ncbi:12653_t:CDS:2 [Acaulospora morrowiae]|uniref:12653_t:CDS:1 n=1 Tax=Acaulospora morrowiae TaxID=94023 RepID=A0A9N8VGM5_9GLOM|nr:12653_t:CDS:2 [Acaulospora morrowiae]